MRCETRSVICVIWPIALGVLFCARHASRFCLYCPPAARHPPRARVYHRGSASQMWPRAYGTVPPDKPRKPFDRQTAGSGSLYRFAILQVRLRARCKDNNTNDGPARKGISCAALPERSHNLQLYPAICLGRVADISWTLIPLPLDKSERTTRWRHGVGRYCYIERLCKSRRV